MEKPRNLFIKSDKILELKITLNNIRPPIYRKIQVPDFYTFHQLHHLIQLAFEWENIHMYIFFDKDSEISAFEDDFSERQPGDAKKIKLKERFKSLKDRLLYVYDFGDNWEHTVELEKVLDADPSKRYPACISGQRNAPPEDVGGAFGFEDFVEAMNDMKHPQHDDFIEWYGRFFDEMAFSKSKINTRFRSYVTGKRNLEKEWDN